MGLVSLFVISNILGVLLAIGSAKHNGEEHSLSLLFVGCFGLVITITAWVLLSLIFPMQELVMFWHKLVYTLFEFKRIVLSGIVVLFVSFLLSPLWNQKPSNYTIITMKVNDDAILETGAVNEIWFSLSGKHPYEDEEITIRFMMFEPKDARGYAKRTLEEIFLIKPGDEVQVRIDLNMHEMFEILDGRFNQADPFLLLKNKG